MIRRSIRTLSSTPSIPKKRESITLAYEEEKSTTATLKLTSNKKRKLNSKEDSKEDETVKSVIIKKDEVVKGEVAMPKDWEKVYLMIIEMRKAKGAAVDSVGIHIHFDEKQPRQTRFHVLISAMLSSQTKDEINGQVMQRLKALEGGLTLSNILSKSEEELAELLYPVGFYKTKSKHILKSCQILKDKYDGDVPNTLPELLALPGVGPKMAILVLQVGWQQEECGICVDVHVHRISNRLGWVKTWNHANVKSQDPEKTRKALQEWLPVDKWFEINHMLVGFGQTICSALAPKCEKCSLQKLCPSFSSGGNIRK